MTGDDWIERIIPFLGVSGIIGAIVMLFKMRPEVARVTVSAAEGAVIVQKGVIESLTNEIQRLQKSSEEKEKVCSEEIQELQDIIESISDRKVKRRRKE